ncbi:MAG: hypothetical protein ACYCW6_28140 [Candidatus Xenobia bacterium]
MSLEERPGSTGDLIDRSIWLFRDHFGRLLTRSIPYLLLYVLVVAGVCWFCFSGLGWWLLAFIPATIPLLHVMLSGTSRLIWTECLGMPLPEASMRRRVRYPGVVLGVLGTSLSCGVLLCLPYRSCLLIPLLVSLEREPWMEAYRHSRRIAATYEREIWGVLLGSVGLVLLLALVCVSLFQFALPWLLAAFELHTDGWSWLAWTDAALCAGLLALALPLLEVSLVLLYRQVRIFNEGADLEAELEQLQKVS